MADHLTKQIRDRIIAILKTPGLPTTGQNVFKSGAYALSRNALPGLIVTLSSEAIAPSTAPAPRKMERSLNVNVEIILESDPADDEDDIDGPTSQILKEVEVALAMPVSGPWTSLTERGVVRTTDSSSQRPVGRAMIVYQALYYAREDQPDVRV